MTPARRAREAQKAEDLQMKLNERKFLEFSMGCDAGDVTACHSLGEWYSVMRSDYAKSIEIYRPNCETHKHAASCLNLGILLAAGRGVDRSDTEAVKYFTKACELGNVDACDMAGRAHVLGEGCERDIPRGAAMLARACDALGGSRSCRFLGEMHLLGLYDTAPDKPKAAAFLEKACDGFEVVACRNLSVMHRKGDGVPADASKADAYLRKALEIVEKQTGKRIEVPGFSPGGGGGGGGGGASR